MNTIKTDSKWEPIVQALDRHLVEKKTARVWIAQCVGGNLDAFPYRPASQQHKATLSQPIFPKTPLYISGPGNSTSPRYLVNIPLLSLPGKKVDAKIQSIGKLFLDEAFGSSPSASNLEVWSRISVLLGINQICSIDGRKNMKFIDQIENASQIQGIALRVFGFFVNPFWTEVSSAAYNYSVQTSFTLLRLLDREIAKKVRKKFELASTGALHPDIQSQISIVDIRDKIRSSSENTVLLNGLRAQNPSVPTYFCVMDADCLQLRVNGVGLFSRIDPYALLRYSGISTGYSLPQTEIPILKIANWLDMHVRAANEQMIPFSAYYSEAFSCFYIPPQNDTGIFSFSGKTWRNENKQLITNGRNSGVLGGLTHFSGVGGVVTTTPARMKERELLKKTKYSTFSISHLKEKQVLEFLSGAPQSHIQHLKWAKHIYSGLQLNLSRLQINVFNAAVPKIFGLFDPLERMKTIPGRYVKENFDNVLLNYLNVAGTVQVSQIEAHILHLRRQDLLNCGISQEVVDKVTWAAMNAGKAIYDVLYGIWAQSGFA